MRCQKLVDELWYSGAFMLVYSLSLPLFVRSLELKSIIFTKASEYRSFQREVVPVATLFSLFLWLSFFGQFLAETGNATRVKILTLFGGLFPDVSDHIHLGTES